MVAVGLRKRGRRNEKDTEYTLTRRVVSFHNRANDAWVIVRGGVYDITTFLDSHPGGAGILEPFLGDDASAAMDGGEHSHSAYAYKLLEKYRIGELSEEESIKEGHTENSKSGNSEDDELPVVDWNKAILPQIGDMGPHYLRWIHSFPTTDHTVKMFQNDIVESLTKCAWYVPLLFWLPVIGFELTRYAGLMGGWTSIPYGTFLSVGAVGFVSWLLFEYTLHRYVFHLDTDTYWGNIIHFLIHGHHHITPMDFDRLVFPPVPAMILAAPFYFGAPALLGDRVGYPWLFGFALGYLTYDMTHFYIHHHVPKNAFMRECKRRHVFHHYFDPKVNYGISNPLFDYVFDTIKEPRS